MLQFRERMIPRGLDRIVAIGLRASFGSHAIARTLSDCPHRSERIVEEGALAKVTATVVRLAPWN
jgi:hypothetical protein